VLSINALRPAVKKTARRVLARVIPDNRAASLSGNNDFKTINAIRAKKDPQEAFCVRIKDIAATRVRYGFRRMHVILGREGWHANRKRLYRPYREEGLVLRTKRPKRRVSAQHRNIQSAASAVNKA
jgi:putative transposase